MRLLQEVTLHSKGGSSGDVGHRRRGSGSAACLEARLLQQAAREAAEGLRVRGEAGVRAGTSRLEDSQTPRLLLTSEQQPQRLDSEPGALQSCSSHSEEGRSVHRLLPGVKGAGRTPCREGRAGCLTSLCRCAEQELLCLRGPGGHLSGFYLSLWQAERQDPHRPLDPPLGGTHFHTPPPPGPGRSSRVCPLCLVLMARPGLGARQLQGQPPMPLRLPSAPWGGRPPRPRGTGLTGSACCCQPPFRQLTRSPVSPPPQHMPRPSPWSGAPVA